MVSVDFDLGGLSRFLQGLPVGQTGFAFVVEVRADGTRRVIAHPDAEGLVRVVQKGAERTSEVIPIEELADHRVPADLVRSLLLSGQETRLGGERRTVTIHFSDIANFTAIAETLAPEALVEHLGQYLHALSESILETGGTVDKYIGDAIRAFWGAPERHPAHAVAACTAAVRNQERLAGLRRQWQADGKPLLFTRIGLNTGDVVVGNIGSAARLNYTVMGDAVNLASRLEGLNKYYGTQILISECTYQEAKDAVAARPLDWVSVKGKTSAVLVYELLGLKGGRDQAMEDLVGLYSQALEEYRNRDWARAIRFAGQALAVKADDRPAQLLIERCRVYQASPPEEGWDGVHRMDTK